MLCEGADFAKRDVNLGSMSFLRGCYISSLKPEHEVISQNSNNIYSTGWKVHSGYNA